MKCYLNTCIKQNSREQSEYTNELSFKTIYEHIYIYTYLDLRQTFIQ